MNKTWLQIFAIILFMLSINTTGFGNGANAVILEYSADPGNNYDKAEFRLWLPGDLKEIRAVAVLVPGSNWDGRDAVNDSVWQEFAMDQQLALVACYFTDKPHEQGFIEEYVNVSQGTGQTLLDALDYFAEKSNHSELASVPLLLWGISAGGQFNYEFTAWKPERVAAFVVNKGGIYYSALVSHAARKVPGLLFTGEKDMEFRTQTIEGLFAVNRRGGALWALTEEPNTAHDTGRSRELALLFFKEILPLRIAEKSKAYKPGELVPMTEESGYLGNLEEKTIKKIIPDDKAPDRPTAWLPTLKVAELWQDIVSGKTD